MAPHGSSVAIHPGYASISGPSTHYADAPAPFFICTYDDAPKGVETTRRFAFVDLLPKEA